jgi:hypothetical protein
MKTIYKYPLESTDKQTIYIPHSSKFLTLKMQYNNPCLWFEVNSKNAKLPATIFTVGTGHDMRDVPENSIYLGTYQLLNGSIIFHVYMLEK